MGEGESVGAFDIGSSVTVTSPGHRLDGRVGTVTYRGEFFGTWGVNIDEYTYGFLPSEIRPAHE